MTEKPLAAGEGGMLNTDDRTIYERAVMFGHGDHHALVSNPDFKRFATVPFGGYKYRMHQMTSAVARVQLRHFDNFRQPGLRAMERFFRAITQMRGVAGNYPLDDPRITVGSSYAQRLVLGEEIVARVPVSVIAEALRAEGVSDAVAGGYPCHHLLPFWNECDVYGDGQPTRIAFTDRDVRQGPGDCPQAERIAAHLVSVPRMVRYDEPHVDRLIEAYHRVLTHLDQLEGLTSQDAITRWRTAH